MPGVVVASSQLHFSLASYAMGRSLSPDRLKIGSGSNFEIYPQSGEGGQSSVSVLRTFLELPALRGENSVASAHEGTKKPHKDSPLKTSFLGQPCEA